MSYAYLVMSGNQCDNCAQAVFTDADKLQKFLLALNIPDDDDYYWLDARPLNQSHEDEDARKYPEDVNMWSFFLLRTQVKAWTQYCLGEKSLRKGIKCRTFSNKNVLRVDSWISPQHANDVANRFLRQLEIIGMTDMKQFFEVEHFTGEENEHLLSSDGRDEGS